MNELTNRLLEGYWRPSVALIVYERGDNEGEYFAELRAIKRDGQMGEGLPISFEFLDNLYQNFSKKKNSDLVPYGLMPPNMLYCDVRKGSEKYVWYNLPCRRMMFFSEGLCIENSEYNMPGIIYVATENKLQVFAYKGGQIPNECTKLYSGPFFNCTDAGVCIGNAKLNKAKKATFSTIIEYWEKLFWNSEFSHLNGGNPTKHNLVLVTKACHDNPFDEEELKTSSHILKNILK